MWKWCKTVKIYENSCISWFVICLKCDILIIDTWNKYMKKSYGMVDLFFYFKFMLGCLLFRKNKKKIINLFHSQKQLECHKHILNKI